MKTFLISAALLVATVGFSQRGDRHASLRDMSPEQIATLKTKKLDLALDLSEKQENQIHQLQLEKAEMRQAKKEEGRSRDSRPDADERFEIINKKLDRKIETKEQMKQILNKEQFEKWEKLQAMTVSRSRCKVHRGK